MNTSILAEELAPLEAQIDKVRQRHETLKSELRVVEAELNTFSTDRERFDTLREVCNALDKLGELKANELFWEGIPEAGDIAAHVEQVKSRIARFEEEISGIVEKQQSIQKKINICLEELDFLYEEVRDAYDREERRKEEFVIEREISSVPYREMIMPWAKEAESERRFRRAVLLALLICLVFGAPISLIKLPIQDRSATVTQIPERFVKLVKKERPKPVPARKPAPKSKEEPKEAKKDPKTQPEKHETEMAARKSETTAAREKAESAGVLKFKEAFADLMKETPVANLGTEARLSNDSSRVKGQAVATRSIVGIQAAGGSSGGIGGAGVSRNIGNGNADRLGSGGGSGGNGVGFVRVESSIAGPGGGPRPLSDGPAPGRTDEEIQIVFDRYKTALYRIYNTELRKDPTLRGKILMRISIEPSGEVSMCKVESTDLDSPELVAKIVERIKKFNFGPKEGVKKMTILYPIDFLPSG